MNKICRKCNISKPIDKFYFRPENNKYRPNCIECLLQQVRCKRRSARLTIINSEEYLLLKKQKMQNKLETLELRKVKSREIKNKRKQKRRKEDPAYRLRENISVEIRDILKQHKAKRSFLTYLNYSLKDLKLHIESLFEPWMNWNNQGKYKNWNDNDLSTWTWQLDHIIPHSTLKYTSMEDDNFKKCWDLDNLRPLSAKQNVLDGVNRIRHIKEK